MKSAFAVATAFTVAAGSFALPLTQPGSYATAATSSLFAGGSGTFNGKGHTIKNVTVKQEKMGAGIIKDADFAMIDNCIRLFVIENTSGE